MHSRGFLNTHVIRPLLVYARHLPVRLKRLLLLASDYAVILAVALLLLYRSFENPLYAILVLSLAAAGGVLVMFLSGVYKFIASENNPLEIWPKFLSGPLVSFVPAILVLKADLVLSLSGVFISTALIMLIRALAQARYYDQTRTRIAIYGAGAAGGQVFAAIQNSSDWNVVCFIDDNPDLAGRVIRGRPVFASDHLGELIEDQDIDQILIAIPSLDPGRRKTLITRLAELPVKIFSVPGLDMIVGGKAVLHDYHELRIDELLGRDQVMPDEELLHASITGKNVMITGAGGSIGSELVRQISKLKPAKLVLFESSEFALYEIERGLKKDNAALANAGLVIPVLGNITDQAHVEHVCTAHGIAIIFHAAAYKHVPMVEHNPVMAVKNNVIGTYRVACAAERCGVGQFVLISTDKAVRPTNVMGASKRLAELVLQARASMPDNITRYCMVRFGNVLGSSGSVVPLFWEQIGKGGPLTLTHKNVTRYFMSIPEAAQLVLQAASLARHGDLFLLDMGEPVKIFDLATVMIHSSGNSVRNAANPDGDIEIIETGLRPGEKMYEELLIGGEARPTRHPKIMSVREDFHSWDALQPSLEELERMITDFDDAGVISLLQRYVEGFTQEPAAVPAGEKQGSGQAAG